MTTQKNGSVIPQKNGNKVETTVTLPVVKKEEPKPSNGQNPIGDRLETLNKLFSLVEQREKLTDTLDDLKKFDYSSDNTKDCISLDDGKGHKFVTYQPDVVTEVVKMVRKYTEDRLTKIDSQLMAA